MTHTLCLPSLYEMILTYVASGQFGSLRVVIADGEELPRNVAARHADCLPGARLYNEYGPTEATVWCTARRVEAAEPGGRILIGWPIPDAGIVGRPTESPNGCSAASSLRAASSSPKGIDPAQQVIAWNYVIRSSSRSLTDVTWETPDSLKSRTRFGP